MYSGKMEELNKDLGPGLMLEGPANTTLENNHVGPDEPAFSDEEEEMPLR